MAFNDEKGFLNGEDDLTANKSDKAGRILLSISGDKAKIDGKFTVSESIEIDCEVKGKLDVKGQIVIQQNGFVNADVETTDAEIMGKYEGNLTATGNVEIKETGIVGGNIKTDSLIINKGAIFSGIVSRMSDLVGDEKKNKTKFNEKLTTQADEKFGYSAVGADHELENKKNSKSKIDIKSDPLADENKEKDDDLSL